MPTSVWAELGAVAGRRAAQQGQPSDCEGPLGLDGGSPAPSPLPLCTGPWEHQAWHCPWRPVLGPRPGTMPQKKAQPTVTRGQPPDMPAWGRSELRPQCWAAQLSRQQAAWRWAALLLSAVA